ncbi:MAG TPA: hypothetical protein VMJ10_23850 [Kofleriaceae bacterium]|nr:hypothetical protein [Kofleriaceae bacterium]
MAGDELDDLIAAAVRDDERAWQALWCAIEPPLTRIVAQPRFLGRLGQREDDRRNIVVAVMARLRADRFRRLQLYLDAKRANPGLRFISWLRVVAKRAGVDYLRAHPDYLRGETAWVEPGTLPPASQLRGERPPVTNRGTARELLRHADGEQRRALELWAACESYDAIARALSLPDARAAERVVRAAIERLRRRFRA